MTTENMNFSNLIDALEDGQFRSDLERATQEIIGAMRAEVKMRGGVPTAALAIALSFKLEGGAIEIKPEMKTRLPKETRQRTILWPTSDNKLTRRNPNQQELPFRDVNKPAQFVGDGEEEADAASA